MAITRVPYTANSVVLLPNLTPFAKSPEDCRFALMVGREGAKAYRRWLRGCGPPGRSPVPEGVGLRDLRRRPIVTQKRGWPVVNSQTKAQPEAAT